MILCRKIFVAQWRKKTVEESLSVSLISVIEKFYALEG